MNPTAITRREGPVNVQTTSKALFTSSQLVELTQDFLLVASFGLWATLLGLIPVLLFGGSIGH